MNMRLFILLYTTSVFLNEPFFNSVVGYKSGYKGRNKISKTLGTQKGWTVFRYKNKVCVTVAYVPVQTVT
jgi:hypothetical protein